MIVMPPTAAPAVMMAPPARVAAAPPRMMMVLMPFLVLMHKPCQDSRDKEANHINDAKRKTALQHRAHFARVARPIVPPSPSPEIPKGPQAGEEIGAGPVKVAAVCVGNAAELVDTCDQGAEETEVHEPHEGGGAFCGAVSDEGFEGPDTGKYRDDEEHQDVGWC